MIAEPTTRIQTPRDLLSIIPLALGYQPTESLLVICIRKSASLGLVVRVSYSDIQCLGAASNFAEMVAKNAIADDAGHAFIVCYTKSLGVPRLQQLKNISQVFQRQLAAQQITAETWLIDDDGFRHLDCELTECCPPAGFPLSELENTVPRATLVYRGYSAAASRTDYLSLAHTTETDRTIAQKAAKNFTAKRQVCQELSWRQEAFSAWLYLSELVRQNEPLPAEQLGIIGAGLTETAVRDAVLMWCIPGGLPLTGAILTEQAGALEMTRNLLEPIMTVRAATRPNVELCRIATRILSSVAAHVAKPAMVAPLTLLAFLAWWVGDGTKANHRIAQALDIEPQYSLAQLLCRAQQQLVRPGWLQARVQQSAHALAS